MMYNGKQKDNKSINYGSEKLIRTILDVVEKYFQQTTNVKIMTGSPFITKSNKDLYKDKFILNVSFMGKYKANVVAIFTPEMMVDFIKDTMHESVSFDDSKTLKQLSLYMIQKMSKSIGKMLLKSFGSDAYFRIASTKTMNDELIDLDQVVIPVIWKKHEFSVQFFI